MNIVVPLILLIIVLLVVWVCVRMLRQALAIPTKQRGPATCGQCSYEIADLSFDRCPECGGKLLEVGIVTPSLTVRCGTSVFGLIATWTALVFFFTIVSFGVFGAIWSISDAKLPQGANARFQRTLQLEPDFDPIQDYDITIDADLTTGRSARLRVGKIEFLLVGPSMKRHSLQFDAVTKRLFVVDGSLVTADDRTTFSHEAVVKLYRRAGLDVDNEAHLHQINQLVEMVGRLTETPSASVGFSGSVGNYNGGLSFDESPTPQTPPGLTKRGGSSSGGLAPSAPIVAGFSREELLFIIGGGFWLIVYAVGLRLMLLGRKRALAHTT